MSRWIKLIVAAAVAAATLSACVVVPVGPPLIWASAAGWLYFQGQTGWAIFMVLWGLLAVSSVDNFVKPYLISRSSSLPMLLIVIGVFGGIAAFGFIGTFIGPPMIAVGLGLVTLWIGPMALSTEAGTESSSASDRRA